MGSHTLLQLVKAAILVCSQHLGAKVTSCNISGLRLQRGEAKSTARPPAPPKSRPSWGCPSTTPPPRPRHSPGWLPVPPSRPAPNSGDSRSSVPPPRGRRGIETARRRSGFAGKTRETAAPGSAPGSARCGLAGSPQRPASGGAGDAILWRGSRRGAMPLSTRRRGLGRHFVVGAAATQGVRSGPSGGPLTAFLLLPPSAESPLPQARAVDMPSSKSLSPLNGPSRHHPTPPQGGKAPPRQKKGIFFCHFFFINAHRSSGMLFGRTRGPWLDRNQFP